MSLTVDPLAASHSPHDMHTFRKAGSCGDASTGHTEYSQVVLDELLSFTLLTYRSMTLSAYTWKEYAAATVLCRRHTSRCD